MATRTALGASDWVEAAYLRFMHGGLSAVKVEPVAKDLGATKGSFYWHFENRMALVEAVMQRWEREETDRIIEIADVAGTPHERLAGLFAEVASRRSKPSGETTLYVEAEAERVQSFVARVVERRIDYIADLLVEMGFDRDEARHRGTIATAVVLGMQQIAAGAGAELVEVASRALTESALRMMLAPPAA